MQQHQVRDGIKLLRFDGVLLGHVSSQSDQPRWTEMSVYKTWPASQHDGIYVLEKVGRSVLTHVPGCTEILEGKELPRFQAEHPGDDPDIGYEYHRCVPDEYDFTTLLVEEDRYWATQCVTAEAVTEALYRRRGGSQHLPRISLDLLEQVERADPEFGSMWRVEYIA
jgi:hypothetical protein